MVYSGKERSGKESVRPLFAFSVLLIEIFLPIISVGVLPHTGSGPQTEEVKTIHTTDYYAYVSEMKSWNSKFKAIVAVAARYFFILADKVWGFKLGLLATSFLSGFLGRVLW